MEWVKTTAKTVPQAIEQALDSLGVDESEAEIVVVEEPRTGLFGRVKGMARVEARIKPVAVRPKADRRNRRGDRKSRQRGNGGRGGRSRGGRNSGKGGNNNSDSNADKTTAKRGDANAAAGEAGRRAKGESSRRNHGGGDASTKAGGRNRNQGDRSRVDSANNQGPARGGRDRNRRDDRGDDQLSRDVTNDGADEQAAADATAAGESPGSDTGSGGSRKRRRGGRGRGGAGASSAVAGTTAVAGGTAAATANGSNDGNSDESNATNEFNNRNRSKAGPKSASEETPVEHVDDEVVADHLKDFLGGLTTAFGLDGDVNIENPEPEVMVATVAGQHGLMVGPKGRTLDAIQELARVSTQRSAPSAVRIRVDVGGYRQQRSEAIASFAVKAAEKAIDNGVEVKLDPMPASDRKAVHDALTDNARVETRSIGNEPRRRVLIVPLASADSGDSEQE